MENGASFGEQLRRLRVAAGLSQEALAERAGLTPQAVGSLERGERQRPYPNTVRALADALGLDDAERATLTTTLPRRGEGADASSPPSAAPATSAPEGIPFAPASRLPATPTALIGREREMAETRHLIECQGTRLLTITGPGGVGKTRLALQLAADLRSHFEGRVAFIDLAPIRDPDLVLAHIGRGLGIHEAGERTIPEALAHTLAERLLLLVLDNLEHVLAAATDVGALLEQGPGLVVLATSREPLRLRWEREFPLAPLPVPEPDGDQPTGTMTLATQPAVALLVERAQAVRPAFALTPANAPAVADLCRRLDGLPLALELAAARLKILSPAALLARLGQRLDLLTAPVRDAPVRHQTLRTAIGWSYELLTPEEQRLFGCLAVFVGGCTPEAVAAVCLGGEPADIAPPELLDQLASLVDKNLLQAVAGPGGEPRFQMLETVGEYARDVLQSSGEEAALRSAHACYVVAMVEAIEPRLWGPEQVHWIAQLAAEQENLRAALRWSLDHGDYAAVARLLRRLHFFWWMQGQMVEAQRWARDLLDHGDEVPPPARAIGYFVRGWAAIDLGDPEAGVYLREALTLARAAGDRWTEGHCLLGQGFLRPLHDDLAGGIALMWEGQRVLREAGDEWGVGISLTGLSTLSVVGGLLDDAETFAEEHVVLSRRMGDLRSIGHALDDLAMVALLREDYDRAVTLYRESIALCTEVGQLELVAYALQGLAVVAAGERPRRAARLFGAAEVLREAGGVAIWPARRKVYDRALAIARDTLGEAAFEADWAAGRALSRRAALAEALDEPA